MRVSHPLVALVHLLLGSALVLGLRPAVAAGPITFTQVTPTKIAAGTDYATDVRGRPWDFSDEYSYSSDLSGPVYADRGSVVDGMFVGTSSTSDAKLYPQDMTIPNTVPTQNEGGFRPIDTSRYRYLTFRMFSSASFLSLVYWHKDHSFAPRTYGASSFKQIRQGWHTYTWDLATEREVSAGGLAWTDGPIQGIAIKTAWAKGVTTKVDWIRLSTTPPSAGPVVSIRWTPTSSSFNLYYDTDAGGANATLIAASVNGSSGQYNWTTPNLAPGTYYLIAESAGTRAVSMPFVVNAPPSVSIRAPSYTSGPDYATTVLGNPWDMSDSADIALYENVASPSFNNGIFSATNTNGDPALTLNMQTPIDPSRFYYATYRMRVNGPIDIGAGSVARLFWWTDALNPETMSVTKDIVVYEGWRSVSVDLRGVQLEPGSYSAWTNGAKAEFRLDPHEFSTPRGFEVDDVKLTGNDRASTSFAIRYAVSDANSDATSTTFFYDTDRSGANGRPITCATTEPTIGNNKIYLPLVGNGPASASAPRPDDGSSRCLWHVAAVPNGDYYIYAVVSDGINTSTVYSDTPVEVRH